MNIRGKSWKFMGGILSAGIFLLVLTPLARAGDGVIEINQAKAEAGGVTGGDTEGFPVTIDQPGSYRLTGNLVLPDSNTTAIEISVNDVTIDLNGFSILGPNICTGASLSPPTVSCSSNGSGRGITGISASPPNDIAVVNGTVRGMGGDGISFISGRVERVRLISNGGRGMSMPTVPLANGLGVGNLISANLAVLNGADGIFAGLGAVVTGNAASLNGRDGIFAFEGSVVTGNTADYNTRIGITTNSGANENNKAINNGLADIL